MKTERYRLSMEFNSLADLRAYAQVMEDRTLLPDGAVIREMDTTDNRPGTAKFIWGLREDSFGDDTIVYPELSPKWESRMLKARLAEIEGEAA